jgi:hypothetical protein
MEIRSLANDLKFGEAKETDTISIIRQYWLDDSVLNTKEKYNNKFCLYDYENNDGTTWELKSRRCAKTAYPTTIIPTHKVRQTDKKQIFMFNFTDCSAFIDYDADRFAKYNRKMVRCFRSGASSKPVEHIEIPIEDLINI